MTTLADAAALLAGRGYRVFPIAEDKAPLTARGHHDGTTDLETIEGWEWGGGIGLVVPDRVFVVDVDPRNNGDLTLGFVLEDGGHRMPPTRTVRTRSGGLHYYFSLPDDRDLRGKLGPGVDIKKPSRGYVLVPPTPGYTYARGGRPSLAPQWLLDELTVERRSADAAVKPKFFRGIVVGSPYGLAALRQKLRQVRKHEEGGRRANLNACAYVLGALVAGGELDADKTLEALLEAALDSGLSEDQALKTMYSGFNAGLDNPRHAE